MTTLGDMAHSVRQYTADWIGAERDGGAHGPRPYPIGLGAILATVAMLFAAFTAALLVRRTGTDWVRVPLPPVVWANTAVLLASSAAVEVARAAARRGALEQLVRWLAATALLGVLFLGGQVVAWRTLAAQGVLLPTSPYAAFFYLLSAVHGAHVLGGLGALGWTLRRARGGAYSRDRHAGLTQAAVYWHFVGGVWVYLLAALSAL